MSLIKRAASSVFVCALLFSVAARSGGTGSAPAPAPSVATVAQDVATIAAGLQGALQNIPNVPPAVATALADLSKEAAALSAASSQTGQQSVVKTVEADLNAVVAAAGSLPLPPPAGTAIQAAEVLLPVIEAGVNLVAGVSAPINGMTPAEARLILKADVAK